MKTISSTDRIRSIDLILLGSGQDTVLHCVCDEES